MVHVAEPAPHAESATPGPNAVARSSRKAANGLRGREPGLILIEQRAELDLWDVKN